MWSGGECTTPGPAQTGVKLKLGSQPAGSWEQLHSGAGVTGSLALDWTRDTGIGRETSNIHCCLFYYYYCYFKLYFTADTGTGSDSVVIVFGTPDRSALIWGITFHPEQFAERHPGGLNIQISYNYYKEGGHAFWF